VIRPALASVVHGLVLSLACQSTVPSPDVAPPSQPAPAAPVQPSPAAPQPTAAPPTAAALLDSVHELAAKFGPGLTNEEIEKLLDVQLTRDAYGFSGGSRRWRVRVSYIPAVELYLSFNDLDTVTIADVDKRFGAPESHDTNVKEGLANYRASPTTYVFVKYLGGWDPSSPANALWLEPVNRKPPPKGDLFK
jgi:hypothetical protein